MRILVLFCLMLLGSVSAYSQKKDCDQLLGSEVVYQDRATFWKEFIKLKGCGIDSIDVNVFGKASYLNYIYNKIEADKKKITFKDLLKEIQSIKKTHDYMNVRASEVKDSEFLKKIAKKENWAEDKKYLESRGFSAADLKSIYDIINEQDKPVSYETIIILFQSENEQ
jgi:hypothetical protein